MRKLIMKGLHYSLIEEDGKRFWESNSGFAFVPVETQTRRAKQPTKAEGAISEAMAERAVQLELQI